MMNSTNSRVRRRLAVQTNSLRSPSSQPDTEEPNLTESDLESLSQKLFSKEICTCFSCEQILTCPIQLIEGFGNICNSCLKKTDSSSARIRNVSLERVLQELILPCNFTRFGCKKTMIYEEILKHHDFCQFRTDSCFIDTCTWKDNLNSIDEHVLQNHSEHVIKGDQGCFVFNLSLGKDGSVIKLIGDKQFPCLVKINSLNGVLKFSLFQARANSDTEQFCSFELLGTQDKEMSFVLKQLPYSEIFESEHECKDLDLKTLQKDLGVNGFVPVVIRTTNKNDFLEKIKKAIECPICMRTMVDHIYQCTQGHSFCGECQINLQICPICRAYGSGFTRNRVLEDLVEICDFK